MSEEQSLHVGNQVKLKHPISISLGTNGGSVTLEDLSQARDWANAELNFWRAFYDKEDRGYETLISLVRGPQLKPARKILDDIDAAEENLKKADAAQTEVLDRLHDKIRQSLFEYRVGKAIHHTSSYIAKLELFRGDTPTIVGLVAGIMKLSHSSYYPVISKQAQIVQSKFRQGVNEATKLAGYSSDQAVGDIPDFAEDIKSVVQAVRSKKFQVPTPGELKILFGKIAGLDQFRLKRFSDTDLHNAIQRVRAKIDEHEAKLTEALNQLSEADQIKLNGLYNRAFTTLNYISQSPNEEYESEAAEYKKQIDVLLDRVTEVDSLILDAYLRQKQKQAEETLASVERLADASRVVATDVVKSKSHKIFSDAAEDNFTKAFVFFVAGGVATFFLFKTAFDFIGGSTGAAALGMSTWTAGALRLTVIGALGVIAGLFFGLVKSQLHLREHNLHRQRLLDLIDILQGIAEGEEQKNYVLQTLLGAISNFGTSGMVSDSGIKEAPGFLPAVAKVINSKDS